MERRSIINLVPLLLTLMMTPGALGQQVGTRMTAGPGGIKAAVIGGSEQFVASGVDLSNLSLSASGRNGSASGQSSIFTFTTESPSLPNRPETHQAVMVAASSSQFVTTRPGLTAYTGSSFVRPNEAIFELSAPRQMSGTVQIHWKVSASGSASANASASCEVDVGLDGVDFSGTLTSSFILVPVSIGAGGVLEIGMRLATHASATAAFAPSVTEQVQAILSVTFEIDATLTNLGLGCAGGEGFIAFARSVNSPRDLGFSLLSVSSDQLPVCVLGAAPAQIPIPLPPRCALGVSPDVTVVFTRNMTGGAYLSLQSPFAGSILAQPLLLDGRTRTVVAGDSFLFEWESPGSF